MTTSVPDCSDWLGAPSELRAPNGPVDRPPLTGGGCDSRQTSVGFVTVSGGPALQVAVVETSETSEPTRMDAKPVGSLKQDKCALAPLPTSPRWLRRAPCRRTIHRHSGGTRWIHTVSDRCRQFCWLQRATLADRAAQVIRSGGSVQTTQGPYPSRPRTMRVTPLTIVKKAAIAAYARCSFFASSGSDSH